ncbi:hypothetical protein G5I_06585 [Acromyrmex echinatior]|uniref:Uncharacterized protein n=1 Tax=Acromyrmex echinatior TaxID=103372 RepID=F4WLF8_ACREC|nr:hypothetical protein G5I_06585 [Acromyrmex echinatior]
MASRSCPSSKRVACRDYCSFMALRQDGTTRFSLIDFPFVSHDTFVRQSVSICGKLDCEESHGNLRGLYWSQSNRNGQAWPSDYKHDSLALIVLPPHEQPLITPSCLPPPPRSKLRPLLTQSETPAGGDSQPAVPYDTIRCDETRRDATRRDATRRRRAELSHAGQLAGQLIPSGAARCGAVRSKAERCGAVRSGASGRPLATRTKLKPLTPAA